MARIGVAMSGGVDSSATALILKEKGHEVVGLTLRLGMGPDKAPETARSAAVQLGIEHHVVDAKEAFLAKVILPVVRGYQSGVTPNPCVLCNRGVKFPLLWQKAREHGCEKLATGHYARMGELNGRRWLKEGVDPRKSQAYFLARVSPDLLENVLFPLGDLTKEEAREIGRKAGLEAAEQPESQDVCFLPPGGWDELVSLHDTPRPGCIEDEYGNILGRHGGIHRFTVGQRRGLGVALGRPGYVLGMDGETATVRVGPLESLMSVGLLAKEPMINDVSAAKEDLRVRYRYNQAGVTCRILPQGDLLKVEYLTPQRAAPPGQLAVLFQGDLVFGSAWIKKAIFQGLER